MIQRKMPATTFLMSPNLAYAATMIAAGIGVPMLAALNAALGQKIGSPSAAALTLFLVALVVTTVVTLITGPAALKAIPAQPKHLFLGGVLVAFYVLSITYIAPHFGVGNAVFFVLLGQMIAAASIDHFGLFGAEVTPLSVTRLGGILLMVAGIALTQRG